MHKYRLIAKKGEGTFSEVLKAQCVKNGKMTAIKCMKSQFESEEQVNNLREIQALRRLSPHPGIIKLVEVLYEQPTGRLALVFELMDMNIYELIRGRRQYLPEARIKSYMYQLIKAMDHMHRNGIFHRDIKPENILVADDVLKLADFGSCRGIYSKQPYTEYISTRWYRAPECLLTDGYYNYKMDLWGVGCVFFEIVSLFPLFPGTNELDQIHKIHNIMGTPPPDVLEKFKRHATHMELNFPPKEGSGISKLIPHALDDCMDLIMKLLAYNPEDRLSARQALRHAFLKELRDMDKKVKRELLQNKEGAMLPSTAASSNQSVHQDAASTTRAHRKTDGDNPGNAPTGMGRGGDESRVRALPTIKGGHGHNDAPAHQAAAQQTTNGYGGQQPQAMGAARMPNMAGNANTTGLPDLTSNTGMRGVGAVGAKGSANVASTFKAATNKKHQLSTHPKKGTKMSVPAGQKYPTSQTQGPGGIGVGGIQVQGMQGGFGAGGQMQGAGNQRHQHPGGKYGSALNVNMALTSSKYQGAGAGAGGGLSVGPAAKGGGGAGGGGDDKAGKYTSPYSQKYISTSRQPEIDP